MAIPASAIVARWSRRWHNRSSSSDHESLPAMAAAYAFHISRNHPFLDGNKRASLAAMLIFLLDNGLRLETSDEDVYNTIYSLAAGSLSKEGLTHWVTHHVVTIDR